MTSPASEDSPRAAGSEPPAFLRVLHVADRALGLAEQALLAGVMLFLVGLGAYQAIGRNFLDSSPLWSYDYLRLAVFVIAMTGAALSAHTGQIIRMDVLTRALSPRGRAIARLCTGVFTIGICCALIYASILVRGVLQTEAQHGSVDSAYSVLALPIGFALIAFHVFVQLVDFATKLARGEAIADEKQSLH